VECRIGRHEEREKVEMKERRSKVGTRRGVAGWDGKQKR